MKPQNIKEQLKAHGLNANKIANQLKVTRQAVGQTIKGNASQRIREAIAAAINKPVSEIWPEAEQN